MSLDKNVLHWHELTDEERKAIHDTKDYPIISVIDGLPVDVLKEIYFSLGFVKSEFETDYKKEEINWIRDNEYYWEENNHRSHRGDPQYIKDFFDSHLCERFRLYYAARHPGRFLNNFNDSVKLFLSEIYDATNGEFGKDFNMSNGSSRAFSLSG